MPVFFRMSDKKRGEMEREGSWRMGGGKEERWRSCWHALVSNLFESIAQFICFVSTATAEDNQTRRPLDSSYCPPYVPLPTPFTHHPQTPFFFFFHVTCWLKERQCNSQAFPNREMSGREPTSKPCCHGDIVQSRNYRLTHKHLRYIQYTHTSFCARPKKYIYFLPLLFVFWINNIWTVKGKKMAFCLVMFFSTLNRSPPLIYFGEYDFKNDKIYKEYQE